MGGFAEWEMGRERRRRMSCGSGEVERGADLKLEDGSRRQMGLELVCVGNMRREWQRDYEKLDIVCFTAKSYNNSI